MADKTQCNYDDMAEIANKLTSEAGDITQLITATRSKVEDLHGQNWIGEAADAFFKNMNDVVLPGFLRMASALMQAAATAGQISTTFQNAETEARNHFSSIKI